MLCCEKRCVRRRAPRKPKPPPPKQEEGNLLKTTKTKDDVNAAALAARKAKEEDDQRKLRQLYAQRSAYVRPEVHVLPSVSEKSVEPYRRALRGEMRGDALLGASSSNKQHAEYADDDGVLRRFLTARDNDVGKAKKLLTQALQWRESRQPQVHDYEELEREARTGKVRVAEDFDRWGRSVVVFDNTVQNTKDPEANMRFLAFNLEHALRKMAAASHSSSAAAPEKYVVFMHLSNFSLLNNPSWTVTKETCLMLMACFAECCGNIVVYGAPRVFYGVFAMCKPFIDPTTAEKIIFANDDKGDSSSAADKVLADVIGPQWRQLTGAGLERETKYSSPGYRHRRNWTRTLKDEVDWRKKTGNKGALQHSLKHWPGIDEWSLDLTRIFPAERERVDSVVLPPPSTVVARRSLGLGIFGGARESSLLQRRDSYSSIDSSLRGSSYSSIRRGNSGATLALPRDETKDDLLLSHSFDSSNSGGYYPSKSLKTARSIEDRLRDDMASIHGSVHEDIPENFPLSDDSSSPTSVAAAASAAKTKSFFVSQQTLRSSLPPKKNKPYRLIAPTTVLASALITVALAVAFWTIPLSSYEEKVHRDDWTPVPAPKLLHDAIFLRLATFSPLR